MSKKLVKYLVLNIVVTAVVSCTQVPDIDLPIPDDKIVIDGWIEDGKQARVLLTSNSPYFASIDSSTWRDIVLTRAKVTLDDGFNSEVLILRKDERYFPPYYYAGNDIIGQSGRNYTLTAEFGGKTAMAQTSIPEPVLIDTSYFELYENEDSIGRIVVKFTDPPDQKNYYRIFTMRDGIDQRFTSVYVMALDDTHFPGQSLTLKLLRSPESHLAQQQDNYFRLGETILVKLSTMDEQSYDFWSSYQDEALNVANPFASSLSDIRSNVQGDGLGIWAGYGNTIDTIYTVEP